MSILHKICIHLRIYKRNTLCQEMLSWILEGYKSGKITVLTTWNTISSKHVGKPTLSYTHSPKSAVVVNLCLMPAEELVGSTYLSRKTNEKTITGYLAGGPWTLCGNTYWDCRTPDVHGIVGLRGLDVQFQDIMQRKAFDPQSMKTLHHPSFIPQYIKKTGEKKDIY